MDTFNRLDPRGMQGMLARGKNNYNGLPAAPGAGRPPESNAGGLGFDLETVQRRLLSSAAGYRL